MSWTPVRIAALLAAALVAALAPADAAHAGPPDTTITSGPADGAVVLPGPVQYAFTSDIVGATFECKVDTGGFAACTSPVAYDLPPGGHTFAVRAVDTLMQADPTPVQRIWTVRNVPCEQAGAAYREAQSKFFVQQGKLVKAKKQLHRAKNHGTAAQLQHAKNKVRKIRARIFELKKAMNQAIAQQQAVC